jgi:hypothetical protein
MNNIPALQNILDTNNNNKTANNDDHGDNDDHVLLSPGNISLKVYSIYDLIINLFSAEAFLGKLFLARNKILSQAREGKRAFFMFQYPGFGWFQYDNHTIEGIYQLSQTKTGPQLVELHLNTSYPNNFRIHAIASLLLQRQDYITRLYNGAKKARDSIKESRIVNILFINPFFDIFFTSNIINNKIINTNSLDLNREQLISLQNIGHKRKFRPFIMLDNLEYPIHEKNNVSQDTESNEPDTVTLIEM